MNRVQIIAMGAAVAVLVVVLIFANVQNSSTPSGTDLATPTAGKSSGTKTQASTAPLVSTSAQSKDEDAGSSAEQVPIKDESENNSPSIDLDPTLPAKKAKKPANGNILGDINPLVEIQKDLQTDRAPAAGAGDDSAKKVLLPKVPERRYLFDNRTAEALKGALLVAGETNAYDPSYFAPEGEVIDGALMENVASNQSEIPVTVGVWSPFYFQGHKILDAGTKILGTATKGNNRIIIHFNRILFADGRTNPVIALAMDLDGTAGVKGQPIGERVLQNLTPTLLQTATSFASTFEKHTTLQQAESVGKDSQADDGKIYFEQIQQAVAQDVKEEQPYVLVIAGTRMKVRLMGALDVSKAALGYGSPQVTSDSSGNQKGGK